MTVDVVTTLRRLLDKLSAADPVLTSVLKQIIHVIGPFIVELFSGWLLFTRHVLYITAFKEAFIIPVVKRPEFDSTI